MIGLESPKNYGPDKIYEYLLKNFIRFRREFRRVHDLKNLTPAQIAANVNDYDPWAGEGEVNVLRLSTDASRDLTGLATGRENRQIYIINVGAFDLVLKNQDSNSVAKNRIIVGTNADLTLTPDTAAAQHSATLYYDITSTRWRVID